MNINQLKDFLGEKPQHLGAKDSIQNQLRDSGLKQAIGLQGNFVSLQSDKFSSSANFGAKAFASALNVTLEVNHHKPDFSEKKTQSSDSSMFDFNEVAKNVLNFVGGAIKNAKNKGADEEELNKLFEQASAGVLKGIKLAEKDLAGFLNEDIEKGIADSKQLIQKGIEDLRQKIFNPNAEQSAQTQNVTGTLDITQQKLQAGELNIRTRDGDKVSIRFEDIESFKLQQRQIQQLADEAPVVESTPAEVKPVLPTSTVETDPALPAKPTDAEADVAVKESTVAEQSQTVSAEQQSEVQAESSSNAIYYQQQSLSFSVTGELDEEELKAIGQLVSDTSALAEEFFNGDIETAFNQALELGFDEKELSSFALQLTKIENTQVIKAYETVSHFGEENTENEDSSKAVKPVADYLDKLLHVLDGSRKNLENSASYENVVNEMINRLGDVATPDLITAINRFNDFNQKLVNNLPLGFQPQS